MIHQGANHGHAHHPGSPADRLMDEAFWDERYRSQNQLWSGKPNAHLVSEVSDLAPGTALDLGCGEGADAIWLAERGWQVTAVDISIVALQRAADHALTMGGDVAQRITWQRSDINHWIPAPASYDLVSAQFMHLPPEQREPLQRRLAESVAAGGTLLIVGHHPSDLQSAVQRWPVPELFFTATEVAALLEPREWDVIVNASRERRTTDPTGAVATIHDAVLRARRRG